MIHHKIEFLGKFTTKMNLAKQTIDPTYPYILLNALNPYYITYFSVGAFLLSSAPKKTIKPSRPEHNSMIFTFQTLDFLLTATLSKTCYESHA